MKYGTSALVTTELGEIPEDELQIVREDLDQGDVWVSTRECTYKGTAHPEAIGRIIRRDVWVTMKQGQAAAAAIPDVPKTEGYEVAPVRERY